MEIFGVKFVGIIDYYIIIYFEVIKGIESVGNDKFSIEKIVNLKLDLIIISDY